MTREIKFRGLRKDHKEDSFQSKWRVGNLLNDTTIGEVGVGLEHYSYSEIIPETIGQYTGLKDSKGTEIFEGDIFLNGESKRIIEFRGGNFHAIKPERTETILLSFIVSRPTNAVIGNIHENPELIEK